MVPGNEAASNGGRETVQGVLEGGLCRGIKSNDPLRGAPGIGGR